MNDELMSSLPMSSDRNSYRRDTDGWEIHPTWNGVYTITSKETNKRYTALIVTREMIDRVMFVDEWGYLVNLPIHMGKETYDISIKENDDRDPTDVLRRMITYPQQSVTRKSPI